MSFTQMPTIARRQPASVDEYQKLKQRLFVLRCRQAKLIREIQQFGLTPYRSQRAAKLERRIYLMEVKLANSELVFPNEEPVTLREVIEVAKKNIIGVYGGVAKWCAIFRDYLLVKAELSRPHAKRPNAHGVRSRI